MSQKFNAARLEQLKTDAFENIDSYNDPDTPKALAAFTEQIKGILQAAPDMLQSVPEYLPVALYGRVKFPGEAKLKWSQWLKSGNVPAWDDFKTTVAFNNADLPLVKTIRGYNESLLIEACAVLFMLSNETSSPVQRSQGSHDDGEGYEEDDDDYSDRRDQAADDYDGNDDEDEEGYDDQYDEITFKREGR